jgi:error-prone DNA polymerase
VLGNDNFALRLGLRQIDGMREDDVKRLVAIRDGLPEALNPHLFCPQPAPNSPLHPCGGGRTSGDIQEKGFSDMRDVWRRSELKRATLERLAAADAFRSLGLDRRQALWEVRGLPKEMPLPLFDHADAAEGGIEQTVALPLMPLSEHVVNDYRTLRLSLKAHPMSFLRARVAQARIASCADLKKMRDGTWVSVAGVVLVRQRPGSAQGVVFMTIEDETGVANSVIWPKVLERERKVVMGARLVVVHGRIQRHEDIIHVVAARLEDRSDWLRLLTEEGEVLSLAIAHGDHVKHAGGEDSRERLRERAHPRWHPRRHPRNERIIPRSRDFH